MVTTLLIAVAYLAGWLVLAGRRPAGRPSPPPRWGIALVALLVVGFAAQLLRPELLAQGRRDPAAIRAGEWWRLLTAIVLQDGGWAGATFNLITLAVTALLAGAVLAPRLAVITFLAGGVVANLLTALILGQAGAGSSMATLVLLAVAALVALRSPTWRETGLVVVLVVLTAVLLARRDQHGLALALGLVAGLLLRRHRRRWSPRRWGRKRWPRRRRFLR